MSGDAETIEGTKKCDKCGADYTLYCRKLAWRERGSIDCKCGHEIESWNSSHSYRVEFRDGTSGKKHSD